MAIIEELPPEQPKKSSRFLQIILTPFTYGFKNYREQGIVFQHILINASPYQTPKMIIQQNKQALIKYLTVMSGFVLSSYMAAKILMPAGAALGATIGTFIFPGIGTTVGGVVGTILGIILALTLGTSVGVYVSKAALGFGYYLADKYQELKNKMSSAHHETLYPNDKPKGPYPPPIHHASYPSSMQGKVLTSHPSPFGTDYKKSTSESPDSRANEEYVFFDKFGVSHVFDNESDLNSFLKSSEKGINP